MSTIKFATYIAVKEIWRNRGRFLLLSLVIALITLLVLFIAALGEGLANANREYLANLDAQLIVFREKSDYIIPSSRLDAATVRAIRRVDGVMSAGGIYTAGAEVVSTQKPVKVSVLGVEIGAPGLPDLSLGSAFRGGESNEVVIDQNLVNRSGMGIGDQIVLRSTQGAKDQFFNLEVVGITAGQSYLFQPSIFVSPATWERIRPQSEAELRDDTPVPNVVAVRLSEPRALNAVMSKLLLEVPRIQVADIATTIASVPGYSAQQSTVQTQGVFTLLIGILVIGGFFQIQVLQKVPQIGVLKAIGSSNASVGLAAVIQIVTITAIGVGMGWVLTFLLSLGFPPTIPLSFDGVSAALSVLALMLIGPLGGLVSVLYAVRIEPLRALRLQ
ncbi:MAG TPA: ABC transporter permease [Anaerolineales bacterium]|nr:ABC transporter permease [Anaerolineales bacterium]